MFGTILGRVIFVRSTSVGDASVLHLSCMIIDHFLRLPKLQVELMRNIEDRDEQYKIILEEKLPMTDENGLIQLYQKELGNAVTIS